MESDEAYLNRSLILKAANKLNYHELIFEIQEELRIKG
jgi:hypothetical protein